jgi:hypothetical protein
VKKVLEFIEKNEIRKLGFICWKSLLNTPYVSPQNDF